MLKGINPIINPDLLKILAEMGHGDEIVLADAHFPGHTFCPKNVLRTEKTFAYVITRTTAKYGNILKKMGVTPCA